MSERSFYRPLAFCLLFTLLAAGVAVGLDHYGRGSRVFGKSGGINSTETLKLVVDEPVDAYRSWKESGYRGRTVVYLADRWETCNPDEMMPAPVARPYPLEMVNPARFLEENSLNTATFLYIASLNRIARKIVAILPEQEISRLRESLRKGKDFRVTSGGIDDVRQGFPRSFTTADHFVPPRESVLLYVGASYFVSTEPEELLRLLAGSGITSDCILLCREKGKDSVTTVQVDKLYRFARLMGMTPASMSNESLRSVPAAAAPRS